MDLIILVLLGCLLGFCVWLLTTKIPMPDGWATTLQIVSLVLFLLYVLSRIAPIPNVMR
jgi:hypothetical protein